jgi:hypothetical protein
MLGVMHTKNFPSIGPGSANFAFDDVWEKRRVHVLGAP